MPTVMAIAPPWMMKEALPCANTRYRHNQDSLSSARSATSTQVSAPQSGVGQRPADGPHVIVNLIPDFERAPDVDGIANEKTLRVVFEPARGTMKVSSCENDICTSAVPGCRAADFIIHAVREILPAPELAVAA
jgi:hypothetical protein